MTPQEMAEQIRDAVRTCAPGGGEQYLDQLVALAEQASVLQTKVDTVRMLVRETERGLQGEGDRQLMLESLIAAIQHELPEPKRATVTLFKASGKYYTIEQWIVPENAIGPYDMERSPDFHTIDGGPVLVDSQEPWGHPFLFPGK